MRTADPAEGYLDEEFARFRAKRLEKEAAKRAALAPTVRAQPTAPEAPAPLPAPAPAAPAVPAVEPRTVEVVEEQDDDLDFERFRAKRLRESARRRALEAEAPAPTPSAPSADDGLFFGTSTAERRQARAIAREARVVEPPPSDTGAAA